MIFDIVIDNLSVCVFLIVDFGHFQICGVSGRKTSYTDLRRKCAAFGGALRRHLGLKVGDRIGIHLPNCPEFLITALGSMDARAIPSPMNPLYTAGKPAWGVVGSQ